MKLSEIIDEENIVAELKAKDKKGVLGELAETIAKQDASIDRETLVKILVERENLGTTGIGDGVAIPHGKIEEIKHPMLSFGRSKEGLDFDSLDGLPVFLFFLLVAPEDSSEIHLQVLARIAKIFKNNAFRKKLKEAGDRKEIYQMIIQTDEES